MGGIYIWHFPDGKGYIGQTRRDFQQRLKEETYESFDVKYKTNRSLAQHAREVGLKGVTFSFYEQYPYGINADLLESFKNTLLYKDNMPLSDLDAAEILYILKCSQSYPQKCSLNEKMGGQALFYNLKQNNGKILQSFLESKNSPQEAYNLLSMSESRQENIQRYVDLFKETVFTDRWIDFESFLEENNYKSKNKTLLKQTWGKFVEKNIIKNLKIWTTNSQGMKSIQQSLTEWIIVKMESLFNFLPTYLNKYYHQNNKMFNSDAYRDFQWAGKNLYKELLDADSEISRDLREKLHRRIGLYLGAGKTIYLGNTSPKFIAKYIYENIKKNESDLATELNKTLTEDIKNSLSDTLAKVIKISSNKTKNTSSWYYLFKSWVPSFNQFNCDQWLIGWTQQIFRRNMDRVRAHFNPLNHLDRYAYTYFNPEDFTTAAPTSRRYKKESNAYRMNRLDSEYWLSSRIKRYYEDCPTFINNWFEFYRPLITWWREYNSRPNFNYYETVNIDSEGNETKQHWLGYEGEGKEGKKWFLYESENILTDPTSFTIY